MIPVSNKMPPNNHDLLIDESPSREGNLRLSGQSTEMPCLNTTAPASSRVDNHVAVQRVLFYERRRTIIDNTSERRTTYAVESCPLSSFNLNHLRVMNDDFDGSITDSFKGKQDCLLDCLM